jgi:hypothetical protein
MVMMVKKYRIRTLSCIRRSGHILPDNSITTRSTTITAGDQGSDILWQKNKLITADQIRVRMFCGKIFIIYEI